MVGAGSAASTRRVSTGHDRPMYWEPFGAGSVAILQVVFWIVVFLVVWQVYGFDGGPPDPIRYTGPTAPYAGP